MHADNHLYARILRGTLAGTSLQNLQCNAELLHCTRGNALVVGLEVKQLLILSNRFGLLIF